MNPEIKTQWVAALRSGEYDQTYGLLHRTVDAKTDEGNEIPTGYCCLGVLCDLALKAGVVKEVPSKASQGVGYAAVNGDFGYPVDSILPTSVQAWSGVNSLTGELGASVHWERDERSGDSISLTELNDEARYDFNQIADVIEEQF